MKCTNIVQTIQPVVFDDRCILGALSPAVTVPALVNLQDRKYGVAKGIPTMLLAAGGLDNVLCVTAFSVFLGIIFSEGNAPFRKYLNFLPFLFYHFVLVINLKQIEKEHSFFVFSKLSPDKHGPNPLDKNTQCGIINDQN